MPNQPQSKRLMIARHGDISRTVEVYTGGGRKRLETAKAIVLGDGRSKVRFIHDPAVAPDPITLRCISTRDDPFVKQIENVLDKHRQDPQSAGPITLIAYDDAGSRVDQKVMIKAVVQEIRFPDGDTMTAGETMAEIICQPEDSLSL